MEEDPTVVGSPPCLPMGLKMPIITFLLLGREVKYLLQVEKSFWGL